MAGRASSNAERTERAPSKGGGASVKTRGPASTKKTAAGRARAGARSSPRGAVPGRAVAGRAVPGRRQEIIALALFGVAVFLVFVLVAGAKGGFVGEAVATGLTYLFGRLAFLVPAALIAVAVTTVLGVKVWRSYWFAGAMIFLFGLFLLVAAGVPPFGGRDEATFVRPAFESASGALGEALYSLFHGMVGRVGVGIIGWIALFAGFSLATGVTLRRMGQGTKRAAQAVKETAERSTLVTRRRDAGPLAMAGNAGSRWPDDPHQGGFGPRLGPVDLVEGEWPEGSGLGAAGAQSGPFDEAFHEWADGRPVLRSPLAPIHPGASSGGAGVIDGAEAFRDIYATDSARGMTPAPGGGIAAATTVAAVTRVAAATTVATASGIASAGSPAAGAEVGDSGAGAAAQTAPRDEEDVEDTLPQQDTLPGLAREPRQTALAVEQPAYLLPESELLRKTAPAAMGRVGAERDTSAVLIQALGQFGVEARVVGMVVGPRVTRYELQLAPGTKVGKVSSLKDDLAYALATTEIRILAPIPGKSAVGVEVPNQRPDFVTLGDIYREFPKSAGPLMVWLGKDISGKAVYTDLTRLPHLLIAGTTGSGKSGCVNCLVSSVLLRSTPEQVRMIMIDPKKVELSHYDRIPHLLVPVVTNMKDAAGVLHNVSKEMEDRYELLELEHARSLAEMNKSRARRGERPLPYILIVIDELADLMMVSPQEVEDYVIRLAQKSRAVGIHLVVATQRPSADVITGMIKANIPSRIAFAVSSQTDSRVILDVNGAETLLGMGDMLFKPLGSSHLQRVQGAYITEEEIALLVNHWRRQAEPEFREELLRRPAEAKRGDDDLFDPDSDELLADAAQLVIETGSASVSMLQRRLRVGYTRAGRLIDMLERRGIVGPWEGSKPRQILVEPDEFEHVVAALRAEERIDDRTAGD